VLKKAGATMAEVVPDWSFNHFGLLVGVEDKYIPAPYPALTVN